MGKSHKVTVLSDGGWGTALAILLVENGCDVALWGPFPENICEIRRNGENNKFLPGVPIPDELVLEDKLGEEVSESEVIVLASPSQYMRGTLEKLRPFFCSGKNLLVNVAKGIEVGTLKRMSELCREMLGDCRYCVLSGPSHAEEVGRRCPTAVVVASESEDDALQAQKIFMNSRFRIYTSHDVVGVELAGSLKNIFAIAAGMIDGMGLGDNPKAALLTRGTVEMARLGKCLGGRTETFSGLSGIGDLIVTCYSRHSRNRHVGEELGLGKSLGEILRGMGMSVAEGVKTCESAHDLSKEKGVETPIINEIYKVLYKGKAPQAAIHDLMTRRAKMEME